MGSGQEKKNKKTIQAEKIIEEKKGKLQIREAGRNKIIGAVEYFAKNLDFILKALGNI